MIVVKWIYTLHLSKEYPSLLKQESKIVRYLSILVLVFLLLGLRENKTQFRRQAAPLPAAAPPACF